MGERGSCGEAPPPAPRCRAAAAPPDNAGSSLAPTQPQLLPAAIKVLQHCTRATMPRPDAPPPTTTLSTPPPPHHHLTWSSNAFSAISSRAAMYSPSLSAPMISRSVACRGAGQAGRAGRRERRLAGSALLQQQRCCCATPATPACCSPSPPVTSPGACHATSVANSPPPHPRSLPYPALLPPLLPPYHGGDHPITSTTVSPPPPYHRPLTGTPHCALSASTAVISAATLSRGLAPPRPSMSASSA